MTNASAKPWPILIKLLREMVTIYFNIISKCNQLRLSPSPNITNIVICERLILPKISSFK